MISFSIPVRSLKIRNIAPEDLPAILEVYQQCEDFLALGPVPKASTEMVLKDLEISKEMGGVFCGIFTHDGKMAGVVDFVPCSFEGDLHTAYISLLMIASPFRSQGIGKAVVEAVETEIWKNAHITAIRAGVQVNNPRAVQFWQDNGYRIVSSPIQMPDGTTVYDLLKSSRGHE